MFLLRTALILFTLPATALRITLDEPSSMGLIVRCAARRLGSKGGLEVGTLEGFGATLVEITSAERTSG